MHTPDEDWIEKIRNMDHFPGEPMPDEAEMWKRLEAMRFPKKKKKQQWMYWAAGVGLILVLFTLVKKKNTR